MMDFPVFSFLFYMSKCGPASWQNLALRGKATQSDLVEYPYTGHGHAYNAIDGNTDPNYYHGSCSSTDWQQNPWWRVDLLDEYTITSIVITNRGDSCSELINGAEVHVGNSLINNGNSNLRVWVITSIPPGRSHTFTWDKGVSGRYVNVIIPGNKRMLILCEVEVYGYPTPHGEDKRNSSLLHKTQPALQPQNLHQGWGIRFGCWPDIFQAITWWATKFFFFL
uniref:Si:ch211-215k15.4 n=1 Tax=Astyanax mexicanus TaxID=7994 RepID=A0A3B1JE47_ASTMX